MLYAVISLVVNVLVDLRLRLARPAHPLRLMVLRAAAVQGGRSRRRGARVRGEASLL